MDARAQDEERGVVVALVGMMGSGKSSVAAEVAARTGWRLVDLDDVVTAAAGQPITEIFAAEGEAGFRRRETQALVDVLASSGPLLVATGGGVVTSPDARAALCRGATVVWLDAPVPALAARVGTGATRPMLGDDAVGSLRALADARRDLYASVADVVVDAGDGDVAAVAARVLSALGTVA